MTVQDPLGRIGAVETRGRSLTSSYEFIQTWGANRGRTAVSGRHRPLAAGQSKINTNQRFRCSERKLRPSKRVRPKGAPEGCARRDSNPSLLIRSQVLSVPGLVE
jgi:hypothetical protein